jgi:hypothetical protein
LIDNFRTIKWETIHLVIEDILILKNKYLKKKKKEKKKRRRKEKKKGKRLYQSLFAAFEEDN